MQPVTNSEALWLAQMPWPASHGHKYDRGHAVISGGEMSSAGAAKLAAHAALRVGAGLVSVATTRAALPVYAAAFSSIMTKPADSVAEFSRLIGDARVSAVLVGPGHGVDARTRAYVQAALEAAKPTVLDADALSVFAREPQVLAALVRGPCILTPHEGEFARLFAVAVNGPERIAQARAAAAQSHAVVVLKGHETVIAAPDGRAVVNPPASPFLATAGSGDVLAGLCTGLLAQGMPAFEAACAAVWLHSQAAAHVGAGLIAEDIEAQLPMLLQALYARTH